MRYHRALVRKSMAHEPIVRDLEKVAIAARS